MFSVSCPASVYSLLPFYGRSELNFLPAACLALAASRCNSMELCASCRKKPPAAGKDPFERLAKSTLCNGCRTGEGQQCAT